jgi:sugar phosphate permease
MTIETHRSKGAIPFVWALLAGIAVPILPTYLAVALVRRFSVDYLDSVIGAVFGLAGLLGGIVCGYLSDRHWLVSGLAITGLQCATIMIGNLANSHLAGDSTYAFTAGTLATLLPAVAAGAVLGASFGELVGKREAARGKGPG